MRLWESMRVNRGIVEIAQPLEKNGNDDFIVGKYQVFADKWNDIVQFYPGLSGLESVLMSAYLWSAAGFVRLF